VSTENEREYQHIDFVRIESHFTPEHLADFAYRRARGRSWEVIADEFKHPYPDRMRRTLEKDDAFKALVLDEKRALRDEAEADAIVLLRLQLRNEKADLAQAAAKLLLEHTTKQAERDNKLQLEETRAKARLEVEAKRAEAKTAKKGPKVDAVPAAVTAAARAPKDRVFLYGGAHSTHLFPPDHTDKPMQILREVVDGVDFYYVLSQPPGTVEEWERANMIPAGVAG
jgi:hypothetical protein